MSGHERRLMHLEVTKALYDVYPLSEKNDFFPAYLYLKYIHHFMSHVLVSLGIPTKPPSEELSEDLKDMIASYVQQIGDASPSFETSIYHAKVVQMQDAIKLVTQKEDLYISPSEAVVPFKVARDIVIHNPVSIALGSCACRAASENPCMPAPQEVCMFIGDPWASFMTAENPNFRKASQEEAIAVIENAHKMGSVQCAYFKKEFRNSFVAMCNCCSCCCLGVKMWNLLGGTVPILTPSGYVAAVDERCSACGVCLDKCCPFNAISMDEENDRVQVDFDKCMGCGVCVDVCPIGAIKLQRDSRKGEPLDMDELKSALR